LSFEILVKIDRRLGDMDALDPIFEVKARERPQAGEGHISLPRLSGGPDVDVGAVERETLGFVDREWTAANGSLITIARTSPSSSRWLKARVYLTGLNKQSAESLLWPGRAFPVTTRGRSPGAA
jgi:hypothetical protein